jgi:hypothetical protein
MNILNRRKFITGVSFTSAALLLPRFAYSFGKYDDYVVAETTYEN